MTSRRVRSHTGCRKSARLFMGRPIKSIFVALQLCRRQPAIEESLLSMRERYINVYCVDDVASRVVLA